jgi:hypothetical protein
MDHKNNFIVNHRDIQDRIEAVKILIEISIYCDTFNDHTIIIYKTSNDK